MSTKGVIGAPEGSSQPPARTGAAAETAQT